jgi:hypothetical protein
VEIERGTSVRKTMKILEKKGVIRNALVGEIVARILGFPVKEGCYAFDGDYNLIEVLKVLSNGSPCMVSFTILPGYDIFDVDRVLSEKGICKEGEVSKHRELEGFLLPDTYKVAKGTSCELAISVMRENFDKKVLPLFENCFKHGNLADIKHGWMKSKIKISEELLELTITNTFIDRLLTEKKSGGIGLKNTRSRLDLLYPNRYSLTMHSENHIFSLHLSIAFNEQLALID